MRKLLFIAIIGVVLSCNTSSTNKSVSTGDTSAQDSTDLNSKNVDSVVVEKEVSEPSAGLNTAISEKIMGKWALNGSENTSLEIKKSVIFYPEHSKSYPYKVEGDRIKVNYQEHDENFVFKLKGDDTLSLEGIDGVKIYHRVKK